MKLNLEEIQVSKSLIKETRGLGFRVKLCIRIHGLVNWANGLRHRFRYGRGDIASENRRAPFLAGLGSTSKTYDEPSIPERLKDLPKGLNIECLADVAITTSCKHNLQTSIENSPFVRG